MANDKIILLVDDVRFFLELEKSFLKRTSCEILMAENGEEAIEVAKKTKPNLILMDLFMPKMNGDEACKAIKADPNLKNVPIIMVTSAGKNEEMGRCQLAGCDDYLTKPINKMELLGKVKSYLDIPVRKHVRIPIDAQVYYKHTGVEYTGSVSNISEGGLFIESIEPLEMGTELGLKFKVPPQEDAMETIGKVVRVVKGFGTGPVRSIPGMGIQFTHITPMQKKVIADYAKSGNFLI